MYIFMGLWQDYGLGHLKIIHSHLLPWCPLLLNLERQNTQFLNFSYT